MRSTRTVERLQRHATRFEHSNGTSSLRCWRSWIRSDEARNVTIAVLLGAFAVPGEISLKLCADGEVWPLVTETYTLEDANLVHERLEAEAITGRAAIVL